MRRYISPNFTAEENVCKCRECNRYSADVQLTSDMEVLRAELGGHKIRVNSWFRCRVHNNRPSNEKNRFGIYGAGSNDNSWHLIGGAIDCRHSRYKPAEVQKAVREIWPVSHGFGLYEWGFHFDIRPERVDW